MDDFGPLTSGKQVQEVMHDLIGARIALYFPDDVDKVVESLRNAGYTIKRTIRKGGLNDLCRIRLLVSQEMSVQEDDNDIRARKRKDFEKAFSGYGATHFIVKIPRRLHVYNLLRLLPESQVMEIQ